MEGVLCCSEVHIVLLKPEVVPGRPDPSLLSTSSCMRSSGSPSCAPISSRSSQDNSLLKTLFEWLHLVYNLLPTFFPSSISYICITTPNLWSQTSGINLWCLSDTLIYYSIFPTPFLGTHLTNPCCQHPTWCKNHQGPAGFSQTLNPSSSHTTPIRCLVTGCISLIAYTVASSCTWSFTWRCP